MTDHTHPEFTEMSKAIGKVEGHVDGIQDSIKRSEKVQSRIFDEINKMTRAFSDRECRKEDDIERIDKLAHTASECAAEAYKIAKPLANGAKAAEAKAKERKRDYRAILRDAAAVVLAAAVIAASGMGIRYFWVSIKAIAAQEERTTEQ